MKYGALAYGRGPATLSWRHIDNDCVLEWREELAPSHGARPGKPGFGTTLIRMALSNDDGTMVDHTITATHVVAAFRWPDAARVKGSQMQGMPASDTALPLSVPSANQAVAASA